jgi:hypothetical protein
VVERGSPRVGCRPFFGLVLQTYSPTCQHCVLGYELLPYLESETPEHTGLAEYITRML